MTRQAAILRLLAAAVFPAMAQQYPFLAVPGSPKSVSTLFQDSRGRLWTAGEDITCFDGARFFFLRDYGFPPGFSYDVAEDPSGIIWIGAEKGVYRFARGRAERVAEGEAVNVIPVSPDLVLAAVGEPGRGTPETLSLLRIRHAAGRWIPETVAGLGSPGPVSLDRSGALLYPVPAKGFDEIRLADVIAWRPQSRLPISHHLIARFPSNGPLKAMRDRAGCLWLGASGGNSYDCGDGYHALPYNDVGALVREASDGRIIVSGNSMLGIGRPGSFQVARRANGLPGLNDALQARDGTIWIGANTGLYRFASPFRIEYWTIREGLPDPPWSLARVGDRVYAGLNGRIVRLGADRSRWETVANFPGAGVISGLLGTRRGTLLATFMNAGALELAADGRVLARTAPDSPKCCSMRLAGTPEGGYWLGGTTVGTLKRDGSRLTYTPHTLQTQPSGNLIGLKYEPETRSLWACYNGGLVVHGKDGSWREFTTRDGLAGNGCWSLAPLPNGDVWYEYFGFRGFALLRLDAGGRLSVRQFGPDDGTEEPAGDTFDVDGGGRLWRSGERAMFVADPAQADAGHWLRLDSSDGFPANDMNSGSVFADADGSLWWGADNDLAHYIPAPDLVSANTVPAVFVSAFSWDGGSPRLAEAVDGVPHGSRIVAHIGSLQFERRNGLRLRYRVLPGAAAWRETSRLDLPLGTLPSGEHTLELQAKLYVGPWSGTVRLPIRVLRPAWLAWPFAAGYALLLGGLGAGAWWIRRMRRLEAAQLLPDLGPWRMGALLPDIQGLDGVLLDGRFRVGPLLARGGFAYVLEGFDGVEQQPCAIKVFRNEIKEQPWVERRFHQEVAALEKVRHPNVVTIYAHGRMPSGAPYLVMEFLRGRSLREALEAGAMPAARVARILRQLAGALDAIHAGGICHRDVKPENVILRGEGEAEQAVLIDFSIAIVKEADETLHGLSRAAGTFDYMAPEQAVGYAQPSSDVYSLARVVIEMLTGRRLNQLLPDAALDLPDRARELIGGLGLRLSPESIALLCAALEFDPGRRPAAAGAFAEPIARDLEGTAGARGSTAG